MFRLYQWLTGVVFLFAAGHTLYAFAEHPRFGEPQLWFLSGGLAMFFNGMLNLLNIKTRTKTVSMYASICNAGLLLFCFPLYVAIPETQVLVLLITVLLLLLAGAALPKQYRRSIDS